MAATPDIPVIAWSVDQCYLVITPGVETDNFKLDNPVEDLTATNILALQPGTDMFVTVPRPAEAGSDVTLASAGGTETLVGDGAGPALAVKGLTAGAGVSLTGAATDVTVANTDPGSAVSLASAGGTESLVNDGAGPALALKGLTAGAGVSLTGAATDVTVANTDPGSAVTLASAGGTESLVNDGVGPALALKGLTAGAGIALTGAAAAVTITASNALTMWRVVDTKASGTAGGASAAGVNTRTLNDLTSAGVSTASVTLAANQLTFAAGLYFVSGRAPAVATLLSGQQHIAYLYNVTAAAIAIRGSSESLGLLANNSSSSSFEGFVSLAAPAVFEVRHYTETAAANGLGAAVGQAGQAEVYTQVSVVRMG
jgi:hypothetical protein